MSTLQTTRTLALFVLSALLAACGGGGGGSEPPIAVKPPVEVPAPPPAAPAPPPVAPAPPPAQPSLKYPIPDGLWSAPSGSTPASGNYVYLQSDNGDYIGAGRSYNYSNADTLMTVSTLGMAIKVRLQGNQNWNGEFLLPSGAGELQAGYFQNLTRAPFADRAVGGIDWSGEGRGCNTIKGWVVVDKLVFTDGAISALELRFKQHCEGGAAALHGQVRWTAADAAIGAPVGPLPIPAGLWQPPPGAVPASGNYMHLQSSIGDYVGAGRTYNYTQANANLSLTAAANQLNLVVAGDQDWRGTFQGIRGMPRLEVGYYSGLQRFPFHNPILGGLDWSGDGRGCNTLSGWFAIDKVTYTGATLTAVDLRFEQFCDGRTAPLRGQLHWTAGDTSAPSGPQNPPPADLWKPPAFFTPPAGNYVYFISDANDYIGGGATELLTSRNTTISVVSNLTAALRISAGGWDGDFVGMSTLSQLQPGYYGSLQRYPFHNAARGGMSWTGNGRGCNTLSGWFVVDRVSYSLGELTAIDLRFEQHCDGAAAALRGVIHWAK